VQRPFAIVARTNGATWLIIEHRLAPPQHPQSETDQETVRGTVSPANGMVERFNGRIGLAQDHATQWLWTYNNDRPNMGIGGITPAQKLKMAA